jgi:MFS family permease
MSGIITEPEFLRQFPQIELKNKSGSIQALVVAIYEIGCLIGAGGIVAFSDKLGRRRAVIIGACIMLVSAAIQTASFGLHSSSLVAS